MPRGRPRKENPNLEPPPKEQIVESPQYLEADLTDFWHSGQPYRLQRYFIASGDLQKAERIKAHMVAWFEDKLRQIMPSFE